MTMKTITKHLISTLVLVTAVLTGFSTRAHAASPYALYDQEVIAQDGDLSVQSGAIYYADSLNWTCWDAADLGNLFWLYTGNTYYQGYMDYSESAAAAAQDMDVDLSGGWWTPGTVQEPVSDIQSSFDAIYYGGGSKMSDPNYVRGWNDAHGYISYQNSLLIYWATWVEEVITMTLPGL